MKNTLTLNSLVASLFLLVASGSAYAIDDSSPALVIPTGSAFEFARDIYVSPPTGKDWSEETLGVIDSFTCSVFVHKSRFLDEKLVRIQAGSSKNITKTVGNNYERGDYVDFYITPVRDITVLIRMQSNDTDEKKFKVPTIGQTKKCLKMQDVILNVAAPVLPDATDI